MSQIFDITAASDSVHLRKGVGEAAFTVTNSSGRHLRGRARIVPLGAAKPEWFTIEGEAERDFPVDATEQYTARIDSAQAPEGRHTFRLDAFSTANPDEDYTQGPAVAFEVAAPAEPEPAGFPWWIVATVAAVLVIAIGLAVWLLGGEDNRAVPNVLKQSPLLAQEALREAGLEQGVLLGLPEGVGPALSIGPGDVFATWPDIDQSVPVGTSVDLLVLLQSDWVQATDTPRDITLSAGGGSDPVTVQAQTMEVLGMTVHVLTPESIEELTRQNVIDPNKLEERDLIASAEDVEIPDVSRKTVSAARAELQQNFQVGQVLPIPRRAGINVNVGEVFLTVPQAGTKLPRNSRVDIVEVVSGQQEGGVREGIEILPLEELIKRKKLNVDAALESRVLDRRALEDTRFQPMIQRREAVERRRVPDGR